MGPRPHKKSQHESCPGPTAQVPPRLLLLKDGMGGTPSHQEGPQVHLHVVFMGENPQESAGVMFHASQRASTPFSGHEASSQEITSWPGLGNAHLLFRSAGGWAGLDLPRAGKATGSPGRISAVSNRAHLMAVGGTLHDRTEQKINKNTQFGQGQPMYCGTWGQETDELVL